MVKRKRKGYIRCPGRRGDEVRSLLFIWNTSWAFMVEDVNTYLQTNVVHYDMHGVDMVLC